MENFFVAVVILIAEGIGAGMKTFFGLWGSAEPSLSAQFAGLGYGFGLTAAVGVTFLLSGGMITTSAAIVRHTMHAIGLQPRTFDPRTVFDSPSGRHWAILWDFMMMVWVIAFQFAGDILMCLAAKHIDVGHLIPAGVHTVPFGPLANAPTGKVFLGHWILTTFYLLTYAVSSLFTERNRPTVTTALAAATAMGLTAYICVMASYVIGLGTVLSFSTDLAIAIVFTQQYRFLWVSFVSHVAAALTTVMLMAGYKFAARILLNGKK